MQIMQKTFISCIFAPLFDWIGGEKSQFKFFKVFEKLRKITKKY
jgi:hypothetical protein